MRAMLSLAYFVFVELALNKSDQLPNNAFLHKVIKLMQAFDTGYIRHGI